MAEISEPKYAVVRRKRAELSLVIDRLYGQVDREIAKEVHGAFLRYDVALLEAMQENLDDINALIQEVENQEGAENG